MLFLDFEQFDTDNNNHHHLRLQQCVRMTQDIGLKTLEDIQREPMMWSGKRFLALKDLTRPGQGKWVQTCDVTDWLAWLTCFESVNLGHNSSVWLLIQVKFYCPCVKSLENSHSHMDNFFIDHSHMDNFCENHLNIYRIQFLAISSNKSFFVQMRKS